MPKHLTGAPRKAVSAFAVMAALVTSPSRADAQDDQPQCLNDEPQIVGYVVDHTTGEHLSAVLVSVATTEWASLTTDNGRFLLCGIRPGTHQITAERLGYQTLRARAEAAAPPVPIRLRLDPDPILLEGLEIVTDRFERRRRASAGSVRAFDQEDLASSPYWSAADFVESRVMVSAMPCGPDGDASPMQRQIAATCIFDRGKRVRPMVYLDEFRLIGGWTELVAIPTSHLYMIEVYRRGTHIRAYTHHFIERAARIRLAPLPIW